jgi:hypothetical protein
MTPDSSRISRTRILSKILHVLREGMDLDLAKSRCLKVSAASESLLVCSGIQSMGGVCGVRGVWVFIK